MVTLFKNAERDSKLDLSDYIPLPPFEETVPEPSRQVEEPKEDAAAEQGRAKRSKPDPYVAFALCDIP